MKTKYGNFTTNQIKEVKKSLRGSIFFVLFCIDPATAYEHIGIDVNQLFDEINALIESGACKTLTLKQYDQLLAIISSWHRYFICYGIVMKLPAIPNLDSIQPSSVAKRIKRDVLVGKVVNISGNKTVKIETFRTYEHKVYGKTIKKRKCYLAHDENNLAQIGDKVLIASCRPMSKTKHFRLLRIVRSAKDSTWDCSTNATGRMYESNE